MIEDSADKRDVKQAGIRERLMAAMVQVVGSEGLHAASVQRSRSSRDATRRSSNS